MRDNRLNFKNILVIDFGQLGDVVLSLPALKAIRLRFPDARITVLLGKPCEEIVRIADVSDDQISVDRVELRDGGKFRSIGQILKLVMHVRRRRFDFVIDLHSLAETNLLGYLSGARWRLYANRENRSLDRLARFPVKPPKEDKTRHHTDRYLDALRPIGVENCDRAFRLAPPDENVIEIENLIAKLGFAGKTLIGLFLGAGHPTRRWGLDNFVELAQRLSANSNNQVIVLLGPEERDLRPGLDLKFGASAVVIDEIPLISFLAMLSFLEVLVSGDTGPMHLGAVTGAGIVLISVRGAPTIFTPLTEKLTVLDDCVISDLSVDKVEDAVRGSLKVE